ncbi:MAG: hypothetical protein HUT38_03545 [Candidatus Paceibacter sp.]|nr:hypothetical protein [Candidatus Paceibacter sp.]
MCVELGKEFLNLYNTFGISSEDKKLLKIIEPLIKLEKEDAEKFGKEIMFSFSKEMKDMVDLKVIRKGNLDHEDVEVCLSDPILKCHANIIGIYERWADSRKPSEEIMKIIKTISGKLLFYMAVSNALDEKLFKTQKKLLHVYKQLKEIRGET